MAKRPGRWPINWSSREYGFRADYGLRRYLPGFALGWPSLPRPKRRYRGMPVWHSIDCLRGRFKRRKAVVQTGGEVGNG